MHRRNPTHPNAVRRRAACVLLLTCTALFSGVQHFATSPADCHPHSVCK